MNRVFVLTLTTFLAPASARAQEADNSKAAQAFRAGNQPVVAVSDTTVLCEAEEFHIKTPGWQARPFGTNYFAATFANCFLSRKGYLGAPEQTEPSEAGIVAQIPKAGKYLALVRYEACYRFDTQFRLVIEQNGQKKLDRLYGARDNLRIWAFRQQLKKEVAWDWGAGENMVWEGHDAFVQLDPGPAKLALIAGKQPEPAARRNVDLVMLTSDIAQVQMRIDKENYLPLDGMLTQAGDVFVKLHNRGAADVKLTVPNGTEHSPYWVHIRNWKPITLDAKPGAATDWIEVGHLLDTLSDGQWELTAAAKSAPYDLEFGLKDAAGKITTIRRFDNLQGNVVLAYDADTRYTRRIRLADEVLYELVDYLKKHPVKGTAPKKTLIYGYTFNQNPRGVHPADGRHRVGARAGHGRTQGWPGQRLHRRPRRADAEARGVLPKARRPRRQDRRRQPGRRDRPGGPAGQRSRRLPGLAANAKDRAGRGRSRGERLGAGHVQPG
jgi:hypothetical protein